MRRIELEDVIAVVFIVLVVGGIIAAIVLHERARRECEDKGGVYTRYNCHTVYTTQSCGSGCTVVVPTEVCDYRCAGLPPEDPR